MADEIITIGAFVLSVTAVAFGAGVFITRLRSRISTVEKTLNTHPLLIAFKELELAHAREVLNTSRDYKETINKINNYIEGSKLEKK